MLDHSGAARGCSAGLRAFSQILFARARAREPGREPLLRTQPRNPRPAPASSRGRSLTDLPRAAALLAPPGPVPVRTAAYPWRLLCAWRCRAERWRPQARPSPTIQRQPPPLPRLPGDPPAPRSNPALAAVPRDRGPHSPRPLPSQPMAAWGVGSLGRGALQGRRNASRGWLGGGTAARKGASHWRARAEGGVAPGGPRGVGGQWLRSWLRCGRSCSWAGKCGWGRCRGSRRGSSRRPFGLRRPGWGHPATAPSAPSLRSVAGAGALLLMPPPSVGSGVTPAPKGAPPFPAGTPLPVPRPGLGRGSGSWLQAVRT